MAGRDGSLHPVLVRGGGDIASGVVYRLQRAGFRVLVTELDTPLLVRRAVSFGEAVYGGEVTIDGVRAQRVETLDAADAALSASPDVCVLVDPSGEAIRHFRPQVVVDGRMAKTPLDARISDAPLVVALGPGYEVGVHCHAVVETNRGHNLGRVYWRGSAEPDTGIPAEVSSQTHARVLRAPAAGHVVPQAAIGDTLRTGQVVAHVAGQPIAAPFAGVLRGLIHERVSVTPGMKIGDIDPRAHRDHCFSISDKALAVGGGVLEALLMLPAVRAALAAADASVIHGEGGR